MDSDDDATLRVTNGMKRVVVFQPKGCFRAYNKAYEASTGDIIVPIEDDLHPQNGWDVNIKHALKDCWDQVACLAVGAAQDWCCIEWVVTRRFIEERGPLYHDEYVQYGADTEWRWRARADGVLTKHAPGILFIHQNIDDASYRRKQVPRPADVELFHRRAQAGWPA